MKLAHIELGPRDAPALIFLHGFLGCAEDWRPVMSEFAGDFRCVAIDLPGHGASRGSPPVRALEERPDGRATTNFINSLRELLAQLRIVRCGLVGYSMGGRLALHFALAHPEIVEFLVLESASPGIDDVHDRVARREADERWAAMLEREGLSKFLDAWYAQPVFASLRARPDLLAAIKARRLAGSRGVPPRQDLAGQDAPAPALMLRDFSPGFVPSLWTRLAEWRAPLLFIAGELDKKYCEIGNRVAGLCPRGAVHIVRDSGHVVHEEQRAGFAAALRNFPMIGNSR